MPKKMNKIGLIYVFLFLTVCVAYALMATLIPELENGVRKFALIILLFIVSIHDIREHKIQMWVCVTILGINIIHSAMFFNNLFSWMISFILLVILMILYFINRNLIGPGDILLVTLCVQSMLPENILKFLFLTFTFSAVSGVLKSIRTGRLKNVSVPLSPCIAIAFILLI